MHRVGSLSPAEGETPRFAQLYILDQSLELTQRFANMVLPARGVSNQQKRDLEQILKIIQREIHRVNPYITDFKQIMELDDLPEGKLVLSAKAPNNEHSRRYNLPVNLKEVSILTNETRHDMVIHKRGEGLQFISDLNPKGQ